MYCRVFSIRSSGVSHPISPLQSLLLVLSFTSLTTPPLPSLPLSFCFSSILVPFSLPSHVSLITSTPPIRLLFFPLQTKQLLLFSAPSCAVGCSPTLPHTYSAFLRVSPFTIVITFTVLSVWLSFVANSLNPIPFSYLYILPSNISFVSLWLLSLHYLTSLYLPSFSFPLL